MLKCCINTVQKVNSISNLVSLAKLKFSVEFLKNLSRTTGLSGTVNWSGLGLHWELKVIDIFAIHAMFSRIVLCVLCVLTVHSFIVEGIFMSSIVVVITLIKFKFILNA